MRRVAEFMAGFRDGWNTLDFGIPSARTIGDFAGFIVSTMIPIAVLTIVIFAIIAYLS